MNGRDTDSRALTALQYAENLSMKKKAALISLTRVPSDLLSEEYRPKVNAVLGEYATEFFRCADEFDKIADRTERAGINRVTVLDDEYPEYLREIDYPPPVLFAKGNVALLKTFCIAVVGTRKPTRYGLKTTAEFTRAFAAAGMTVVSGFARGIDSAAHKTCIEAGAPTIAVFGCGADVCYPADNRALYDSLLAGGGLIVTEYPAGSRPAQYRFPERNRIISGLSRGVFIAEAAKKSGSLITVNLAIEQGRDVFAVPGSIYSPESEGCNLLLKSIPHAFTVSPDDVLDCYGLSPRRGAEDNAVQFDFTEHAVLEALRAGELHFEELIAATGLTAAELSSVLVNLELAGAVEQTTGNFYSLC